VQEHPSNLQKGLTGRSMAGSARLHCLAMCFGAALCEHISNNSRPAQSVTPAIIDQYLARSSYSASGCAQHHKLCFVLMWCLLLLPAGHTSCCSVQGQQSVAAGLCHPVHKPQPSQAAISTGPAEA
jgi:hypothetical protein